MPAREKKESPDYDPAQFEDAPYLLYLQSTRQAYVTMKSFDDEVANCTPHDQCQLVKIMG